MRFSLSDQSLSPGEFAHEGAGGFVTFEGRVRDHANGKSVIALEYEAYPEMAVAQGEILLEEAIQSFGLLDARAIHRTGKLSIGEVAVVVQTASAHRREAFAACEWIMDQIKWRVPVWKRETYATGVSDWVVHEPPLNERPDLAMFSRQMRLPEVGDEGQRALNGSRVLLVGVGGLASGCLPALVGAGIGTFGLVDADVVDLSNLHRQTIYAASDVGRLKVERAAALARRLTPHSNVQSFPVNLNAANAEQLVSSYDWVVDGTDSLATKFLLSAVCSQLRKPLVTASVHQFEGQIMTILPDGPSIQDIFSFCPPEDCVGTCAQVGVMGVVPGVMGQLQANEVIKGVLGLPVLSDRMVLIDFRTLEVTSIRRNKRCAQSAIDRAWELTDMPADAASYELVDIRDLDEVPELTVRHKRIPMVACYDATWDRPTVFVCAKGLRSFRLVSDLRARGVENVYSLRGGLKALDK